MTSMSDILLAAVRAENLDAVKRLTCTNQVQLNKLSEAGDDRTALMAAAELGFGSIVIALLGCEETYVNIPNRLGHTALMFASSAGHTDVVRTLVALEYTRVYIWNNEESTALMLAARNGHTTIVETLVARSTSGINMKDEKGLTALAHAAHKGHTEVVRVLLSCADTDVNVTNKDGYTALMLAEKMGHKETILLLEKGNAYYNTDVREKECALAVEQADCAEVVCEPGQAETSSAENFALDSDNHSVQVCHPVQSSCELQAKNTETERAAQNAFTAIMKSFTIASGIEAKLQQLSQRPKRSIVAVDALGLQTAQAIITSPNVKINMQNEDGWTVLMCVAYLGIAPLVRAVLAKDGVDVNLQNNAGMTALMLAFTESTEEHTECVNAILGRNDVNIYLQNKEGLTALQMHQQMSVPAVQMSRECVEDHRAALRMDESAHQQHTERLNVVMRKIVAHDRVLELLVRKDKECPSLFWFYPKQRELRDWLRNPFKCLLQDTFMMVVVCPVTMRVVECGPNGLGWEVNLLKEWVREWGPVILLSIYVMQAAVQAGRIVGIPLPQLPDVGAAANALGLRTEDANQKQLMQCLSKFARETEELLKNQNVQMQALFVNMQLQQKDQERHTPRSGEVAETSETTLDVSKHIHLCKESYKSIHTFLTTGDNAKLGKLEDQLRGSMERVLAEDGDVEWVSVEAVEVWKKKHSLMRGSNPSSHSALQSTAFPPVPALVDNIADNAVPKVTAPSASSASTWLAVRLRQQDVNEELIADCEQKLIIDEDHSEERLFAMLTADEFNKEYLKGVGIIKLGLQKKLLKIHQELVIQYASAPRTPLTPPTPSSAYFASEEKLSSMERQLQEVTSQLSKIEAASSKSSGSPMSSGSGAGGGRDGGGLQQALVQRADTATSNNSRTGQDEVIQMMHTIKSDLGVLAVDMSVMKENLQASLDSCK